MTPNPAPRVPETTPLADGLRSTAFRPALEPEGKKADPTTAAFHRAVEHGFYDGWMTDEQVARMSRSFIEDGQIQTGVYRDTADTVDLLDTVDAGVDADTAGPAWPESVREAAFDADRPVGTFVDFDKTLNAGGPEGPIPARMISGVTVNPAYRRRGILKHMMTGALARTVTDGIPLAALTVSEGSIYGRFGFGAAARVESVQVHTGAGPAGYAPRHPASGRVHEVDPTGLGPAVAEIFGAFHAATRGSLGRPSYYHYAATAQWSPEDTASWHRALRAAVHVTADGRAGGYVTFTFEGWSVEPATVRVRDLVAVDAVSEAELWRYLAQLDLVERVTFDKSSLSGVVRHAASNPRAVRTTAVGDMVWVRILDVAACLRGREWNADGEFLLELSDPLGISDGRYRVGVTGGSARVEQLQPASGVADEGTSGEGYADRLPRIGMDMETLGTAYLGDASLRTLHALGRTDGSGEDVAAISRIMDLPTAPYCATFF